MRYDPFAGARRLETVRLEDAGQHAVRFRCEAGELVVESYAPGILRLRWGTCGGADYGLVTAPDPVRVDTAGGDGWYRVDAGGDSLVLRERPLRIAFKRGARTLLESAADAHLRGGLRLPAAALRQDDGGVESIVTFGLDSGEAVYGLGEKYGPLNRRGQRITSWNEDAWGVNAEASYKNIPFAWSPKGWGLFAHTTAKVVHGVGYPDWSHRAYVLQVAEPALDLFLMSGSEPAGLLERFTRLTGRAPVPPRWSLGVWMSRAYYRTSQEALDVARMLRERRVPCDVFVLDGRAWLKVDTRFAFEWDDERYPDPPAFVRELKALGFRLCLWEYPCLSVHHRLFAELAGKGYLLRDARGDPYVYRWSGEPFGPLLTPLPPSGLIDFTNPDAYAWYRDAHRPLFETGADAMKTDFGEQVPPDALAHNGDTGARLHNVYPLLFNRCVYEATERFGAGGAVVWGRSGWTGSQRYPIQWGGDPQSDWEGMAASIRGGLSWGLSGAPFFSHDVGGFYGPPPDPELYVRWTQAGVMSSHVRFHGTSPREPWHFGEEAERIVCTWLIWRYRLLPYLEACAEAAHRTGLPVARALPLAFPDDPMARLTDEQYLLGPALLVAPVVRPGGRVDVYLPAGRWFDVADLPTRDPGARAQAAPLDGGRAVARTMRLHEIPIYGREGTVLALGPALQRSDELERRAPIVEVYVFGLPHPGEPAAGLTVRRGAEAETRVIGGLPPDARVHACGAIHVERRGTAVECRLALAD